MAESVDIREDMTSVDAGCTVTRFADLRAVLYGEEEGNERRCRSRGRQDAPAEGIGEVSAMVTKGGRVPTSRNVEV